MQVLFATTNPAKVKKYRDLLKEKGIELVTIKDLDFKLDIDENRERMLLKMLILRQKHIMIKLKFQQLVWTIIYLSKNYQKKNNQGHMLEE